MSKAKRKKKGKPPADVLLPSDRAAIRLGRQQGLYVLVEQGPRRWTFYDKATGQLVFAYRPRGSPDEPHDATRKAVARRCTILRGSDGGGQ